MKLKNLYWLPALGLALSSGTVWGDGKKAAPRKIDSNLELLITSPAVVDNGRATYPGPWSFGYLLEHAYGKERAGAVVAEWLRGWASEMDGKRPKANPPRPLVTSDLIGPWQRADGHVGDSETWAPNFENAPFRLLAIVNRMDLAVQDLGPGGAPSVGYYSSGLANLDGQGGEARFVFCITDQEGKPLEPGATIILEYGLDVLGQRDQLLGWAKAWHGLGAHGEIDERYRFDLENLTRAFSDRRAVELEPLPRGAGSAEGRRELRREFMAALRVLGGPEGIRRSRLARRAGRPLHERLAVGNGLRASQLMRIRTNDGAFVKTREFRQFDAHDDRLAVGTLVGSPSEAQFEMGSKENKDLAELVQKSVTTRTNLLLRDGGKSRMTFPLSRATVSPVVSNRADYCWNGAVVDRRLRYAFSKQTCCGCHCGDTGTEFFHIAPRRRGEESRISAFLRRDGRPHWIKDPAGYSEFKMNEMETRKEALRQLLVQSR